MSFYFLSCCLCSRRNGLSTIHGMHRACSCFHLKELPLPRIFSHRFPQGSFHALLQSFSQRGSPNLHTTPGTPKPFYPPLALYSLHSYYEYYSVTLCIMHLFFMYVSFWSYWNIHSTKAEIHVPFFTDVSKHLEQCPAINTC